jgi:hypothetical protein
VPVDESGLFLLVSTTSPGAVWTINPEHFPFEVDLDGETVEVEAIFGELSPQLFVLVRRSVNSVVAAHEAGSPVSVVEKMIVQ